VVQHPVHALEAGLDRIPLAIGRLGIERERDVWRRRRVGDDMGIMFAVRQGIVVDARGPRPGGSADDNGEHHSGQDRHGATEQHSLRPMSRHRSVEGA
jgi:hypothetical protein